MTLQGPRQPLRRRGRCGGILWRAGHSRSLQELCSPTQGNMEGTPAQARASTRGDSSFGESSAFPNLGGRGDPRLPSLLASELNGKEGVDGSSPARGLCLRCLHNGRCCCLNWRRLTREGTLRAHFSYPLRTREDSGGGSQGMSLQGFSPIRERETVTDSGLGWPLMDVVPHARSER